MFLRGGTGVRIESAAPKDCETYEKIRTIESYLQLVAFSHERTERGVRDCPDKVGIVIQVGRLALARRNGLTS